MAKAAKKFRPAPEVEKMLKEKLKEAQDKAKRHKVNAAKAARKPSTAVPSDRKQRQRAQKQLFIPAVERAAPALPLADSDGPMPRRMLLGCAVRYILAAVGPEWEGHGSKGSGIERHAHQALKALHAELAEYYFESNDGVAVLGELFTSVPYDATAAKFIDY